VELVGDPSDARLNDDMPIGEGIHFSVQVNPGPDVNT